MAALAFLPHVLICDDDCMCTGLCIYLDSFLCEDWLKFKTTGVTKFRESEELLSTPSLFTYIQRPI